MVLSVLLFMALCAFAEGAASCYSSGTKFSSKEFPNCLKVSEKILVYSGQEGDFMKLGMFVANHDAWSALAIAGNGGMKGAREIVVRKANGAFVAEDRYSLDYTQPKLVSPSDVTLLFADIESGNMQWGVLLPLDSCKGMSADQTPTNYPIQDHNQWMLWALGRSHTFSYHSDTRGSFVNNLISGSNTSFAEDPTTSSNLSQVDLLMPDVPVVSAYTVTSEDRKNPYVCAMFDLQELGRDISIKHHVSAMTTSLDADSAQYVHHMQVFQCTGHPKCPDASGQPCRHKEVVPDCRGMPAGCVSMVYSWAIGGGPMQFPDGTGVPLGSGKRWLALQMHYYNPNLVENVKDSSGASFFFLPNPAPMDIGFLEISGPSDPSQAFPPLPAKKINVTHIMSVPPACTNRWKQDVTVLAAGYHGHLVGKYFNLEVIRDGAYVGSLYHENGYDFKHQGGGEGAIQTIKRGDEIRFHCQYDTRSKSEPVAFGEKTDEEMCYSIVTYYPAQTDTSVTDLTYASCPLALSNNNEDECVNKYMTDIFGVKYGAEVSQDVADMAGGVLTAADMCTATSFTAGTASEPSLQSSWPNGCPRCYSDSSCTPADLRQHARDVVCGPCASTNIVACGQSESAELYYTPSSVQMPACKRRGDLSGSSAQLIFGRFSIASSPSPSSSPSSSSSEADAGTTCRLVDYALVLLAMSVSSLI